ncbi:M20/M25/M40 family metallo-hydrolase [Metabacillus herbersteinensis]|uniref:M20/M25/M40 family metallo-hydrolase n=1 Tax=Metabacillus herbersteinensis TaxID=283816 RepID=A0ABV6GGP3_9BACI
MSLERVGNLIDNRKDEYLEQLFTLLRQKSISTQNIGVRDCAELLKGMMKEIGIETRLLETAGHPIVYGEIMKDPSAFTLLIYGHYDVQPAEPLDEWLSSPFEPTIRDGKIYCRGVGDNKGQLMAQVLAIKTYLDAFGEIPINIKLVFEGEEECASANLAEFVENNKELLAADLVYTSDGPMHDSGSPFVLLGVRGMLYVELTAKGADWDNHSGNKGNIVPNPSWEIIDLLRTMRDENGRVLIEGFYDHIVKPTEKEIQIIKKLPYNQKDIAEKIGYSGLDMDGETYYRRLTMEPTFNIAGFTSGYGGEGSKTIIPSKAVLKMDMRLVVEQDPDDIFEKFCNHVKKHAPNIEVKRLGDMKPSRTSADHEIVGVVSNAVRNSFQTDLILQPSMGGSLPDYVWTKILGIPSVVVPYANFDEANHSPNENMGVQNFLDGIKCTCYVINEISKNHSNVKLQETSV